MKLNFQILTTLLSFCTTGRTVTEMKNKLVMHRLAFDHDSELVQATIDYMIKEKLIIQTPSLVRNCRKQPATWVTNISLNCYAVKKAG